MESSSSNGGKQQPLMLPSQQSLQDTAALNHQLLSSETQSDANNSPENLERAKNLQNIVQQKELDQKNEEELVIGGNVNSNVQAEPSADQQQQQQQEPQLEGARKTLPTFGANAGSGEEDREGPSVRREKQNVESNKADGSCHGSDVTQGISNININIENANLSTQHSSSDTQQQSIASATGLVTADNSNAGASNNITSARNRRVSVLGSLPVSTYGFRRRRRHVEPNRPWWLPEKGEAAGDYLEEEHSSGTPRSTVRCNGKSNSNSQNHKEQYLQANFQFVLNWTMQNKVIDSVDTLVEWSLIEQINVFSVEDMKCPICQQVPSVSKITRCGHVFCWPCVLHFLDVNDDEHANCPICFEKICINDLKSAMIIKRQKFDVEQDISLNLMYRTKGSNTIQKYKKTGQYGIFSLQTAPTTMYPWVSSSSEELIRFSKYIIAKRKDVLNILEREENELKELKDEETPDTYVEEALLFLSQRKDSISLPSKNCEKEVGKSESESADNGKTEEGNSNEKDNSVEIVKCTEESFDEHARYLQWCEAEFEMEDPLEGCYVLSPKKKQPSKITYNANGMDGSSIIHPKNYYFFQSADGQNIYLHPLNVKMLQVCYGDLSRSPETINGRILQMDEYKMDKQLRQKFTCLSHLPIACQFTICEIDLKPPYVTEDVRGLFGDLLYERYFDRLYREELEKERARQIDEMNRQKMTPYDGYEFFRLVQPPKQEKIDINSAVQFPSCSSANQRAGNAQAMRRNSNQRQGNNAMPASLRTSEGRENNSDQPPSSSSQNTPRSNTATNLGNALSQVSSNNNANSGNAAENASTSNHATANAHASATNNNSQKQTNTRKKKNKRGIPIYTNVMRYDSNK